MGILAAAENVAAAWEGLASQCRAAATAARPQSDENLTQLEYRAAQFRLHASMIAQGFAQTRPNSSETFTLAEQLRGRAQAAAEEAAAVAAALQAQGDNAGAARALDLADQALAQEADAFAAMGTIHNAEIAAAAALDDLVSAGRALSAALGGAASAAQTYAERQQGGAIQRAVDETIAGLLGAVAGPVTAAAGFAAVAALAIVGLFLIRPAARAARRALK